MPLYLAACVLLVPLLGVTLLRHIAWWLLLVLPASGYVIWQLSAAWHSSLYFWYAAASVLLLVLICIDTIRENDQREAAGQPPLTRDDMRARMWGKASARK